VATIALDARTVYAAQRRGTGKNLIDLYRALARRRPDWRFVMLHRGPGADEPFASEPNIRSRAIEMPGDRWDLWQQLRLPIAARAAGADVLHSPANTAPRRPLTPLVATIHDLIFLDRRFAGPGGARMGAQAAAAARKAHKVFTPSEFSKREIVQRFAIPADKVTVNPWAPDANCARVEDPAELARVRAAYGLEPDRPYVFGFGGADPRKNTEGVLRAWARLDAPSRRDHVLLLVGLNPPARARFEALAEELKIAERARLSGFADEADIPALLSGATLLCYPSLAEGFGLPVLDAFVCETAVLTSDATSLPEVAGDAAELVDPDDVEAIAAALAGLLVDDARRAELIARGRERVKRFTWDAVAQRAAQAFEDVLGVER
jgi:glycosyltransferase involved in cell wall biosynthesis